LGQVKIKASKKRREEIIESLVTVCKTGFLSFWITFGKMKFMKAFVFLVNCILCGVVADNAVVHAQKAPDEKHPAGASNYTKWQNGPDKDAMLYAFSLA